jgi:chromosome segregation ATPase
MWEIPLKGNLYGVIENSRKELILNSTQGTVDLINFTNTMCDITSDPVSYENYLKERIAELEDHLVYLHAKYGPIIDYEKHLTALKKRIDELENQNASLHRIIEDGALTLHQLGRLSDQDKEEINECIQGTLFHITAYEPCMNTVITKLKKLRRKETKIWKVLQQQRVELVKCRHEISAYEDRRLVLVVNQ